MKLEGGNDLILGNGFMYIWKNMLKLTYIAYVF